MKRTVSESTAALLLVSMLTLMPVSYRVSAQGFAVPNGSFESGTVGLIPDNWVMLTLDATDPDTAPKDATFIHEMEQTDQKYFDESKSLWMHSRVVDEGLAIGRGSYTTAETQDWIDAPLATSVRIYVRDIFSTHSLEWGYGDSFSLMVNNVSVAQTYAVGQYWSFLFIHGETLNWNLYNFTAVGADGQSWYVYEYSIPDGVDKTHMKIEIQCIAWDWTFYDTSYYADLEFVVDNIELFSETYDHDIAVTDVLPSKTVVGQGCLMSVNVTVVNQGSSAESFYVTAYYGDVTIITPEQRDTFWSMGDVNRDGYINLTDSDIIMDNFMWEGPPGENPADINSDGGVDMADWNIWRSTILDGYFDIWTYFNIQAVSTKRIIDMPPASTTVVTLTWNTTGVAKGNYTIKAAVDTVLGEAHTSDNVLTDGWVKVTIPGDVTEDELIWADMQDIDMLVAAFQAQPSSDGKYRHTPPCDYCPHSPNLDINSDQSIDMADIQFAIDNFWVSDP